MEDLLKRHRQEQRELQNRITAKKKSASKKIRKGVNDECASLEHDLKERQAAEVAALGANDESKDLSDTGSIGGEDNALDSVANGVAATSLDTDGSEKTNREAESESQQPKKKPNRQKARLARRAAEQDALAAEAAEEALSIPDLKAKEQDAMNAVFKKKGLVEFPVRSDGHCLYAALADQLKQLDLRIGGDEAKAGEHDYKLVRQEVGNYMVGHEDDFLPFLDEEESKSGLAEYARKVKETGEWGGQLEVMAAASRWRLHVSIIQGDGNTIVIDPTGEGKQAYLAYYRHNFGLGEHYNSVRKAP